MTCVRIRMPGSGISAQFKIAYSHDAGTDSAKKIRWKITKSPADSTYENAGVSVTGDGECAILSGSGHFTVNYGGSFSAGEYLYLYLWTGAGEDVYTLVTIAAAGSHVCSYTEGTASSVSVSGQYLGSPVTIRISRNNSSFTHTLTYSFEGHTGTIAAGVGTAYTWTPELSVFGPYIPNAVSGVCTVSCTTYNGSVQVGSAALAQVTLSVPAGCVPAVSNGWIASVTAQNAGTAAAAFSSFVQGYSRVKVVFDSGKITQSYGASLASLKVTFQGTAVTASGAVAVTGTAVNAGTAVLRCTCTDSRGRSVSEDAAITVLSYAKPSLSEVTVFRADSGGNADEEGAWIYAKAKVTWSPLDGANGCSMSGSWKTGGGAYGSAVQMTSGVSVLMGGALSATATYTAKITASDSMGNGVSLEKVIPTASCAFHIREGGRGAAFFGYSEKDGELTVNGSARITGRTVLGNVSIWTDNEGGNIELHSPNGVAWHIDSFNDNLLRCYTYNANGEYKSFYMTREGRIGGEGFLDSIYPVGSIYLSFSHTSPASLFGGTWTRIENRFLWACDGYGVIGATGGSSSHTLTENEMPRHTHQIYRPQWYGDDGSGVYSTVAIDSTGSIFGQATTTTRTYKSMGEKSNRGVTYVGGGAAHNNMPPYIHISAWRRIA